MRFGRLILTGVLLSAACSSNENSPTTADAVQCRTLATHTSVSSDFSSFGSKYHGEYDVACRFDQTSNELTCTQQEFAGTVPNLQTIRYTYDSLADFVAETQVVPPRSLWRRRILESFLAPNSLTRQTTDRTFDGARRAVRDVTSGNFLTQVFNYTNWDANGRPLNGGSSDGGTVETLTYDDRARLETDLFKYPGSRTTADRQCTLQFDASGILVSSGCSDVNSTSTVKVTSTERICF